MASTINKEITDYTKLTYNHTGVTEQKNELITVAVNDSTRQWHQQDGKCGDNVSYNKLCQ